jgi:hypothetical protein
VVVRFVHAYLGQLRITNEDHVDPSWQGAPAFNQLIYRSGYYLQQCLRPNCELTDERAIVSRDQQHGCS